LLGYINDCKTQTINYDSASWFADQAIRIVAKTNLVQGPYFAFHKLVKEEQLDAEKLQKVLIDMCTLAPNHYLTQTLWN
jgi:hypothetical protein